jgi:hypothetical protein
LARLEEDLEDLERGLEGEGEGDEEDDELEVEWSERDFFCCDTRVS